MSSEDQEIPAVYRSLSREALERLLENYEARHETVRGWLLKNLYATRIQFIQAELAQRTS